jgi:phage protein U
MMAGRMMQLGLYQFSIDNAAYQRLFRSTEYRWAAIERVGKQDALQFTGLGGDTITLQGIIYPHYKGGQDAQGGLPGPASAPDRGHRQGAWHLGD